MLDEHKIDERIEVYEAAAEQIAGEFTAYAEFEILWQQMPWHKRQLILMAIRDTIKKVSRWDGENDFT
jgi:hypothetical protein